ncbi:S8 family peptidase [Thalassotalea litorea]|uniref:S8 family peptidase n=1 Tax=Thalassotalea litorea TaxID=2020715 RepID=A0A5R9IP62_9GAMM|nr:S8 family serine peptidase [Thalassotalea litorea]TLU66379.1 S8 family peptidase [Thalassotalea litorea]
MKFNLGIIATMIKAIIGMLLCFTAAVYAETNPPTYGHSTTINVENRCIVQFIDDLHHEQVPGLAKGVAKRVNANVQHIYKHTIKGMTINRPCHAVQAKLSAHDLIVKITPDGVVSAAKGKPKDKSNSKGQEQPWNVDRVGGSQDGTGMTAWVIDSGIDLDHPDLNVDSARGFTVIYAGKRLSMNDANGHGTHVAGTIAAINNELNVIGVAAGATVVPVRVLDRQGNGTWSGFLAGIDHVAANAGAGDCVNMSLSGGGYSLVDDAVKAAASKTGAYFVSAAGNQNVSATTRSPARANGPGVYTISAIDADDNLASWSNYGNPPIDFSAPGVNILSLYKGGGTATMSGTSMAAPAACAVLMLSNGNPSTDGVSGNDPDGNPDPIITL